MNPISQHDLLKFRVGGHGSGDVIERLLRQRSNRVCLLPAIGGERWSIPKDITLGFKSTIVE